MTHERKTTPKFRTLRPYSMTVKSVSEMAMIDEAGETEGSLNAKLPIEQARALYEFLGEKLKTQKEGFINFNLRGLLK